MSIELADIMRQFGPSYLEQFGDRMPPSHRQVVADIQRCRTEANGGHLYQCGQCGKKVYVYHACRNRHCPACHRDQIQTWLEQLPRPRARSPCPPRGTVTAYPANNNSHSNR